MLLPLLLTLATPYAHTADPGVAPPILEPSRSPASWTIVLQTTGGMRAVANATRDPIARLVESLPVGDTIKILAVHTRTSEALPLRTIDDAGRAAVAAEIRALELPSAKSTDFGAGLASVADSLTQAGESTSRLVLLVGDFCHEPPLESTYADGGFGCRGIRGFDKLNESFDTGGNRATIGATLFPVGSASQKVQETGLAEIKAFFEPVGFAEVATEPFAVWIDAALKRLPSVRVRPLARADANRFALTATVQRQPTIDNPTGTLLLDAGLQHLGFDASRITLEGARTDVQALRLRPTGSIPFSVDIPPPPFSLVSRTDKVEIPLVLRVDGSLALPDQPIGGPATQGAAASAPAQSLTAMGIPPERPGLEAKVTLLAERHYGLPPTVSLAMGTTVALFTGAGLVAVRRRFKPLRLGGSFSYRQSGGARTPLAIEHLAEAPLCVLPDGSLGLGRREDALLVLRAERPLWNTVITAEIRTGNAEINARPAPRGRHAVVPGATSFQFQDYRLSWE